MTSDPSAAVGILVVGDVMLDRHLQGVVERVSPEAPVPIVRIRQTIERPGGAANTAANIATLGGRAALVGAHGRDGPGDILRRLLQEAEVCCEGLLSLESIPTTLKTRLIAGHQQIARFDEERILNDEHVRAQLCRQIEAKLSGVRWVVISDYAKGVCDRSVCRTILDHSLGNGTRVIVDPKGADFSKYAGASLLTPNQNEAAAVVGFAIQTVEDGLRAAATIREAFQVQSVIVTMGEQGLVFVDACRRGVIPAKPQQVFDVSGAGDTVVAMLAVALAEGADLARACQWATEAAALQVSRLGVSAITREEVERRMERPMRACDKIVSREHLASLLHQARSEGLRIGFTNGCFDLLHQGHLAVIESAAAACDLLVVGINSDASVKRLKGAARPIHPAGTRALVVAALASVAWVCEFDEDTPLDLIHSLQPDVLVKGGDYSRETIVGADSVEARGGRVVTVPLIPGISTTRVLERVQCTGEAPP